MYVPSHMCCLVATMVSLTCANEIMFCRMTTPLGKNLYAPGDSSNAIAGQTTSVCAFKCFKSANCNSFSYNETSNLCSIITSQPKFILTETDAYSYQASKNFFLPDTTKKR